MKWFYKLVIVLMVVAFLFVTGCSNNEKAMVDAVKNNDLPKAESLLDKGVSPNLKAEDGKTILMLASYLGYTDMAELLIEKGADVNAKDKDGKTALMYAAEKGNVDIATLLLKKGADIDATDNSGKTALQIAIDNNQTGMIELLRNWGNVAPAPEPTPTEAPKPAPAETTLLAKPILGITAVVPNKAANNGSVLVDIQGSNFTNGLQIKLVGKQGEITGSNVKTENETKASCFFDLNGRQAGQYRVVLTNPDGQSITIENGFEVEDFKPAHISRILKPIFFNFDSAVIRDDQIEILNQNLAYLKENTGLFVILGGHADERGSQKYNLELTAKRAKAVQDYLVKQGIGKERIIIYAYGKEHPAQKGHDETAWQYNRRVDILEWETVLSEEQVLKETSK